MPTIIKPPRKFALVIFAKNESSLIQETVKKSLLALRDSDSLFVVADQCEDDTAALAADAGARVVTRRLGLPGGKGAAINWFVQNYYTVLNQFDYMIILDADSQIPPDFVTKLDQELKDGIVAAQCLLYPVEYEGSPISMLIALSELVEQLIFERVRSLLGYSVRLRGTGMILQPDFLHDISPRVSTEVEDIALSLLVAEKQIKVRSIKTAVLNDPKPIEIKAASRQRARWFRGQWNAFWEYRRIVLKLILDGFNGWSVLTSIFLKPRWMKILLMLVLGLALLHVPLLSVIILSLATIEILLFVIGVLILPDRWKYLQSFIYIPSFIWMWIRGILLSMKKLPWLRVRETMIVARSSDTEPAAFMNSQILQK